MSTDEDIKVVGPQENLQKQTELLNKVVERQDRLIEQNKSLMEHQETIIWAAKSIRTMIQFFVILVIIVIVIYGWLFFLSLSSFF